MTLGQLDPSKLDIQWSHHTGHVEVPVPVLAALLRAVGGRIVLDQHDLIGDGHPLISMFNVQDPYQIVLVLKEGE